jgi:F-type H+-transporting ATPase subunit b
LTNLPILFAEAETSSEGLGAFNINLKSFLFQLATFVIVLLILKKWVFPKLVATIEARRQTLEESLVKAKQTEEALAKAELKAGEIINTAREQADRSLAEAKAQAKEVIAKAEASAEVSAQRLLAEAQERLGQERLKLREELKDELADLVLLTTEKVLDEKINESSDRRLVERALKEMVHD